MNRRVLIFLIPLISLLGAALRLSETPFRGEHWAMLCGWVRGSGWFDKFATVVNIEYFGDHRFQPLNSAPMILEYLFWGLHFFPSLLVSVLLQLLLAFGVIRLLDVVRTGNARKSSELLLAYGVEFSLFAILFTGLEVLFWTYFHYIQIATTLAVFAVGYFLQSRSATHRLKAYGLLMLASLFYEPFLLFLGILLLVNCISWAKKGKILVTVDIFLPFAACMAIGVHYLSGTIEKAITVPADVSVLNGIRLHTGHDALFGAPGAFNKILFVIYNEILLVLHLARHVFFPAYANKTNLFEMVPFPSWIESIVPGFLALFLAVLFKFRKALKYEHQLLLALAGISFAAIVWGRPGAGHYASTQFRYGYMVMPFLFVVVADWIRTLRIRPQLLTGMLTYLFVANLLSMALHVGRIEKSFSSLGNTVRELKGRGLSDDQTVLATSKAILDFSIPAEGNDVFLIYNARGGLGRFYAAAGQ